MPLEVKKDVRIWPVLRAYLLASIRYPGAIFLTLLGTFGVQVAAVTGPLYLKDFINILSLGVMSTEVTSTLFGILALYAGIHVVSWISRLLQVFAVNNLESRTMADLTNTAFAYLIRHSYDFFTSNFAGTLTRRVGRYSRSYEVVADSIIFSFLPTALFATGSIFVLSLRSVWLGIAILSWVILSIVVQVWLARKYQSLRLTRATADSRMTGALSDAIGNHPTITLFGAERHEMRHLASIVDAWRMAMSHSWYADAWVRRAQHALAIFIEIGLLGGAILLWQRGLLTIGDFVLIQVYILVLFEQVWNIGDTLKRLYDAFADASEMLDIMETPYAIQDASETRPLEITNGKIEFNDVSFSFIDGRTVFEHFALSINGGEKIALVGPSGAGKSTITKLLLRLYDPNAGTITIDGQDVRDVTQESLRRAISFVPQESILFHRTLRDNIAYGKQDATEEEIIEAAKSAHCHEFISTLPQGYDTYVGERGIKLSGGERQRVAIARAILKNAPILVLDEATSSLDSESEMLIQDALAKLMQGKTVIAIAHRLSTIMKMDRIVVMEDGKAVLSGTHSELLAQESNLYKKLWEIQAGGFITNDEEVV